MSTFGESYVVVKRLIWGIAALRWYRPQRPLLGEGNLCLNG